MSSDNLEAFQKAHILIHDKNGKMQLSDRVDALFNPQQYSIDKTNQFANLPIPGRASPIIQFVRGESETLSIELFFDTYTYYKSKDVREYTNKIKDLLKIDGEIHAPPICSFIWGAAGLNNPYFTGIIEKVTTTFTMFLSDGTPVRAKMNLTLRQYQTAVEQQPKVSSPDKTKRRTVIDGDSLWLIAADEFGDPMKWKIIADVNNIDNPLFLESGISLIIPKLN